MDGAPDCPFAPDAGGPVAAVVSRSHPVRASKSGHSLAASLGETRAVIGLEHSKRADGSKYVHWTQERSSCWHFGQVLREKTWASTSVPQRAQRVTSR